MRELLPGLVASFTQETTGTGTASFASLVKALHEGVRLGGGLLFLPYRPLKGGSSKGANNSVANWACYCSCCLRNQANYLVLLLFSFPDTPQSTLSLSLSQVPTRVPRTERTSYVTPDWRLLSLPRSRVGRGCNHCTSVW